MPEFPDCGSCHRPFDSDQRKPLLLPCGDVFCKACLSSQKDKDVTVCSRKQCRKNWGSVTLSDLPTVYLLIPNSTGTAAPSGRGKPRSDAPQEGGSLGRNVTPASWGRPLQPPTGREVVPADDDLESVSSLSSAMDEVNLQGSTFPTCGVCENDFNRNENRPLLLQCSHVVCLMCLEMLDRSNNFKCPFCRQVRARGDIQKLPLVRTLIHPSNAKKRSSAPLLSSEQMEKKIQEIQTSYEQPESSPSHSKTIKMPEFPDCGSCHRPFDSDQRKPLLLPCGDVFCKACLSSQEDKDVTVCSRKQCRKNWGSVTLSDLPTVYLLNPNSTGTAAPSGRGRPRSDAPQEGGSLGRNVTPASRGRPLQPPTGREVVPADDDLESVSSLSSAMDEVNLQGSTFPTCGVCENDFNRNENRPLLLQCSHVVCLMCLEMLDRSNNFKCPFCREVRARGDIQKLPLVRTLIHPSNAKKRSSALLLSPAQMEKKIQEIQTSYEQPESSPSHSKTIEVYVRDLQGQTRTFHVSPQTETVLRLRQRLRTASDCSRYLTYEGQTMEDSRTLASYNVQPFQTIREQARLVGGN